MMIPIIYVNGYTFWTRLCSRFFLMMNKKTQTIVDDWLLVSHWKTKVLSYCSGHIWSDPYPVLGFSREDLIKLMHYNELLDPLSTIIFCSLKYSVVVHMHGRKGSLNFNSCASNSVWYMHLAPLNSWSGKNIRSQNRCPWHAIYVLKLTVINLCPALSKLENVAFVGT
jgi:hypothetical protein